MAKKGVPVEQFLVLNGVPELVPIGAVKPHPDNYRKGDITLIVESMRVNGFYGRLIVQKSTGYILAGNHRWKAAAQLGIAEVPVEWVDVDDETALRILIVDNRASDKAENDDKALGELLRTIMQKDDEATGTGYTSDEVSELLERSEEKNPPGKGGSRNPPSPPSGNGNYKEQYAVTVICRDEEHQKTVYDSLTEDGFTCRVVNT